MPRMNGPLVGSGYKYCFTCRDAKPVGEFYRARSKPDGLGSQCKECAKATATATRQTKALLEAAFRRSEDRVGAGLRMIDLVGLDAALLEVAA